MMMTVKTTRAVAWALCEAAGLNPREESVHANGISAARWGDFIPMAVAALETMRQYPGSKNPWKEAVLDQLICQHTFQKEHESNPWKAVHDMIQWETAVALDPRVSKDARDLIESHGGYTSAGHDDTMDIPEMKTEDKTNGST